MMEEEGRKYKIIIRAREQGERAEEKKNKEK